MNDTTLAKMRPDTLRIQGLPAAPTQEDIDLALRHKGLCRVQVVEVGYCSDTRWRDRVAQKREQHEELITALRAAGWTVEGPHVIVLGVCGAVYASGKEALQKLGFSPTRASALLTELNCLAVQWAHDISCTRRRLERAPGRMGVG